MRLFKTFTLAAGIVGLWLVAFPGPAQTVTKQFLRNPVAPAVAALPATGRLPATKNLHLAIGLPLRNQAALAELLRELYDPASPNYHRYLTPEQFTAQFGPTETDYQTVIAFARANGLTVTATHPNRLLVDAEGPVPAIEKALHITLRTYRHPTENRTFYAPDTDPQLDLAVPILGISGLNNYFLPRPHLMRARTGPGRSAISNAGSGPGGTYMGNDFRAAYAPGFPATGAGQSVGLLEFDGYTASDITYYESSAGLPGVTLNNVLLDGFDGLPAGGEVEVSLDIEMAMSMAPGLSNIIVYEAGPFGNWHDILNRMATDNLSRQLSCSWFIPNGPADPVADQIFQEMASQGQSFFSASGDIDAYTGLISFPSDSPYITQVGGTTLTMSGPGASWTAETVWNWVIEFPGNYFDTGSSGGISTQYPIPYWQTNFVTATNQGSTTMRNVPDVALTADNVYVRVDGMDIDEGGTSCAAPLWAGMTALINGQAAAIGKPPVGFINPALYQIASGTNYANCFHDITTGNNTWSGSPNRFFATPGYDLCTGLGTPQAAGLLNVLLALPPAPPSIVTQPQSKTVVSGTSPVLSVTVSGSVPLNFQWSFGAGAGTNLSFTAANLSYTTNGAIGALQNDTHFPGGHWVALEATRTGPYIQFTLPNVPAGTYQLQMLWKGNNDRGILSLSVDGATLGGNLDQYSAGQTYPTTTFGTVTLAAGNHLVRLTVTGKNAASSNYWLSAAQFNLIPVGGAAIAGATNAVLLLADIQPAQAGIYTVRVSNAYGAVVSSNAVLAVQTLPPAITNQPAGRTVTVGDPASFSVGATGSLPLSFQWSLNGTAIAGATNSSLALTNIQVTQAGNYAVLVANPYGSLMSSNAVLTVQAFPPAITSQPASITVFSGATSGFSVTATGTPPLSYQWTVNGTNIAGANNPTLTLTNIQSSQAGVYAVGVTSPYGSVRSSNAVLTVLASVPPTIVSQPADQTVYTGGTPTFSVGVNASLPLTCQWRFNGANIAGATNLTLVLGRVTPGQAGNYSARLANAYGSAVSSNAVLTVLGQPTAANVHSFNGLTSGGDPDAGLVLSGATLYGATTGGGSHNSGFIFKMNTNGTGYSIIYSFSQLGQGTNVNGNVETNQDGAAPEASLIVSGGELYGTTTAGGGFGLGTVFKLATNGTGFTTLHSFTGGNDGGVSFGSLVLSGSTLYGTASIGGDADLGTVFKVGTSGSGFATLYNFEGGPDDSTPVVGLLLSGSTLYGSTSGRDIGTSGTLFKLKTDGTGFTTFYTFSSQDNFTNSDGAYPVAALLLSGSTLYATANQGGLYGFGTVFKVSTNGTGFVTLHSFNGNDGQYPQESLNLSGGTLYGTVSQGTTNLDGAIFKVATNGTGFADIYTFSSRVNLTNSDGAVLFSGVVLSGSALYGTASAGGSNADGTVFKLGTNGTGFAVLHTFINNPDGSNPQGGFVRSGGTLYGTAFAGGVYSQGVVYSISTNGTAFTVLYNFTGGAGGANPVGELVLSGGTLYGATRDGGGTDSGTVYSLGTNGTGFTVVHSFSGAEGFHPEAGLLLSGGTLYGTTISGGGLGYGNLFSVGTNGAAFTVLHDFSPLSQISVGTNSDGCFPSCVLVQSGGMLYGTAAAGGSAGNGTVFAIGTNGTGFTVIHAFSPTAFDLSEIAETNSDGVSPTAGLTLSGDTLYGTTGGNGGAFGLGTVFSMKTDGSGFTTIYNFGSASLAGNLGLYSDGYLPQGPLILSGGMLYGTAMQGGTNGYGTVFAMSTNGTDFSTLLSLNTLTTGANPVSQLLLAGNEIFGTTPVGAAPNQGTIFEVTLPGGGAGLAVPLAVGAEAQPQADLNPPGGDAPAGITPTPPAGVTISGAVENSGIAWTPGLTLAQAIVAAGYTGADDPAEIVITRNGELAVVNVQDLLNGADVPLEPGDTIEIQNP